MERKILVGWAWPLNIPECLREARGLASAIPEALKSGARLYLMTVGVYAPHRNGAIGTRLLRHALNEGSTDTFIEDAYLHVHTPNTEAIAFYKRFGFVEDGVVQNYYKRLDPPDAAVLKLNLREWKVRGANRTNRASHRPAASHLLPPRLDPDDST